MSVRRLFFTFVISLLAVPVLVHAAKPKRSGDEEFGTYRGFVVTDAATGQILLSENAQAQGAPASMTKLMTFLIVHDALKAGQVQLDTPVPVEVEDAKMGGTQVYLDPREKFPVEDLLYALMVQSANDAASALARLVSGSRTAFVERMNAKARELGMTHTRFVSPHGLPPASRKDSDGDLTTPADFALLCRELLIKTDVLKYTSVKNRTFGEGVRLQPMAMQNHNNLIGKVVGVDGLKTGYTKNAGYCLSATALRNGRRVIVVIMGSFGPGGAIDKGRSRDRKTIELLEKGFAALPADSVFTPSADASPISPVSSPSQAPVASPVAPSADAPTIHFPPPKK